MSERRRQRQQRIRHDVGGNQNPVGASNRTPEQEKTACSKPSKQAGSGVAYAEPKEYESVTVMPDKEKAEPQKYRRPGVLSNWSRYEELCNDDNEEGEDYLLGEDFSLVLEQQAISGRGYLQLKGESNWEEKESNILVSHGLGVLHIADLVSAINTLPLYMQLNIPEESLPESVLEYYSHLAEDNKKIYRPSCNKYNECLDVNEKIIENLRFNDNEPLDLINEEANSKDCKKNAVDVALSLSKDLGQVPEDVDLETFIEEPLSEKQVHPSKEQSPIRQPTPPTVNKPVFVKECDPVKEAPVEKCAVEETVPKTTERKIQTKTKTESKIDSKSKDASINFDFGLPKKTPKTTNTSESKTKTSFTSVDVKSILPSLENATPQNTEDIGPSVDLDASENPTPVLVSKVEAKNLEDWLDSMLDD